MKIDCSRCGKSIKVHSSQINQKLWRFYKKTKLYMCKWCRRELRISFDPDAIIRKLRELKSK